MMFLRKYGDKPFNIAVVHGGPGAGGEMAPIGRNLSNKWGIIEPIQTKKTIQDQIFELKSIILEYCFTPVIMIGYSWGAWLSLLFTAQNQELVKKVIIVSSGPFEESFVKELHKTRMSRLKQGEREEFNKILSTINLIAGNKKDQLLKRLGELASKTDNYNPIKLSDKDIFNVKDSGDIYQKVWSEAADLRKSGQLLERITALKTPVTAIHGDFDPHPSRGVQEPLFRFLTDFQFYLLKNCGHTPWREKEAIDEFYQVLRNEIQNI